MNSIQWKMDSKIGPLYLVASSEGLQGVFWKVQPMRMLESLKGACSEIEILSRAVNQLEEYFEGKRRVFDLPLDIRGTSFQKGVWEHLNHIPYGETLSYKEIATQMNHPKAVRAIGTANGANPLCIIIPCHRVIAADGSLGGYSGGLDIKSRLLHLERENDLA